MTEAETETKAKAKAELAGLCWLVWPCFMAGWFGMFCLVLSGLVWCCFTAGWFGSAGLSGLAMVASRKVIMVWAAAWFGLSGLSGLIWSGAASRLSYLVWPGLALSYFGMCQISGGETVYFGNETFRFWDKALKYLSHFIIF